MRSNRIQPTPLDLSAFQIDMIRGGSEEEVGPSDPEANHDNDVGEDEYMNGYETVGLDSRKHELEELGVATSRSKCFGCTHFGEREQTAIQYEEMMELIEMSRSYMTFADPVALAKEMADKYAELRTVVNSNVQPGKLPLQPWTAPTILQHFREHQHDPQTQRWVQMCDLLELMAIAKQAMVEEQRGSKRKRIINQQHKIHQDLFKQYWELAKLDTTKMPDYSGGAVILTNTQKQGPISVTNKNIVDVWRNESINGNSNRPRVSKRRRT